MSARLHPEASALLFRHLALAQRGGVPLAEALEAPLADPSWFGDEPLPLALLADGIRRKGSLAAAVRDLPEVFTPELAALLQTAEERGRLPDVLEALARDHQFAVDERTTIRATTQWPRYLLSLFGLLVVAVLVFLIPQFQDLFDSFGSDLPPMTRGLVHLSTFLRADGIWLLGAVLLAAWLIRKTSFSGSLLEAYDRLASRFPGLTASREHAFSARLAIWMRACSDEPLLLRAAVARLRTEATVRTHAAVAAALEGRLDSSEDLPSALHNIQGVPAYLSMQARLAGRMQDPAAALDHLCEVTADRARRSLEHFANRLTLFCYLVIGTLLGGLVMAVYLPIFKLGSAI